VVAGGHGRTPHGGGRKLKLTAGEKAPNFELRDADGKVWRLSDLRGTRIVLYFYPADDTPGCTAEACDFRDSQQAFLDGNYLVLGVSPQGADSHRAFSEKLSLNFPLLIDEDMGVARSYGAMRDEAADFEGIPLRIKRSTFVIDENGRIDRALYGVHGRGHVASLRNELGLNPA
jgi:thioredoxin-dependent peroxiredoxin